MSDKTIDPLVAITVNLLVLLTICLEFVSVVKLMSQNIGRNKKIALDEF